MFWAMISKNGGNAPRAADLDKMVNTLYQCKSALTYNFFDDLHFGQHDDYLWSDHCILVFHKGHNTLMMKT